MSQVATEVRPRPVFCVIDHLYRDVAVAEAVRDGRFTAAGITGPAASPPPFGGILRIACTGQTSMQSPQRGAPGFSRSSCVVANPGLQSRVHSPSWSRRSAERIDSPSRRPRIAATSAAFSAAAPVCARR